MMSMLMFMIGMMLMLLYLDKFLVLIFFQNLFFFFSFIVILYLINMIDYNNFLFIYMDYGVDKISLIMIILSFWIISLMILSVLNMFKYYINLFMIQLIILMISLMMFFFSLDLIKFYIYFEISMIPILMMILGWGVQPERLYAGFYLMMYMLLVSFPFLILLIYIYLNLSNLNLMMMVIKKMNLINNYLIYLNFLLMFLIKLPIYGFHLWLPKAHVEAPVFGSMVLAGVLLKLGGYGVIRILMFNLYMNMKFMIFLIIYIFLGSIYVSMMCIRQIDLKMLIAYSSIVHMGFMMVGMLSFSYTSIKGSLIMMVSHGLCSSGLFCLLNMNYKRINSRNLMMNKGMNQFFLSLSMWWFLFCIMNMAAPPSLNLVSEILLIISILKLNLNFIYMVFIISFFSGVYSIYLYSFSQHGMNYFFKIYFNFITIDEYLLLILHWIPLNFFILNLSIF